MTRDGLVTAIAEAAHKRDAVRDAVKDWQSHLREAEAVLETIEAEGWTVMPHEAAQALDDSAALMR